MKFVGLWVMQQVGPSLLRAGSQLLDDSGNRLRRWREEVCLLIQ